MHVDGHFRRRILLVDSDATFLQECTNELRNEGYEVLTADDGFTALHVLRGAKPDVLVTGLNLPRMSGFELLSVVRTRFPAISVLAVSGEYTAASVPNESICDAFIQKGPSTCFEVIEEVRRLVSESPVRASRPKVDLAPVWIPRSRSGHIIIVTCPECLRSFSAVEPATSPASETCVFCGADVRFQMSAVEVAHEPPPDTPLLRSVKAREKAHDVLARSRKRRGKN